MFDRDIIDEEVPYDGKVMMCETDLKGNILFVNRRFTENLGFTKDEVATQTFEVIRHPDLPKEMLGKMWTALEQREKWKGYVKLWTKEGKYLWASVYFTPTIDENGKHTGYTAAFGEAERSMVDQMTQCYAKVKEDPSRLDELVDKDIKNFAS